MVNDNNITVQKFPLINQQVEIPQKTEKPQKIQSALPKSNSIKAELMFIFIKIWKTLIFINFEAPNR